MKKKIINPDLRNDWKSSAEDEIMQLNEDIDTLELPESTVLEIEKYITQYKHRLNSAIDEFEITTLIALQNKELFSDMLNEIKYDGLTEYHAETMSEMLEMNGYFVMKCTSLAEQIKADEFREEMKINPYQLTLIA